MNARPSMNDLASGRPIASGASHHNVREFNYEPARTVDSGMLFQGVREIGIAHRGELYRLKITKQGKLILNK